MDWEELLRQSEAYEQNGQYALAASSVEQALAAMPDNADPENRGRQVLRAVDLWLQSRQRKKAKQLAQSWLDRNSLPESFVGDLRNQITEITNLITVSRARARGGSWPGTASITNPTALVAPTNPLILDDVANRILALPEPDLRNRCARALRASITLDIDRDPPRPMSPNQIAADLGLPVAVQLEHGICLTKDAAFSFLERLGVAPKTNFFRRLNRQQYEKFFDRSISSDGGKPYVFTYAEILHFEQLEIQLQLPLILEDLLN